MRAFETRLVWTNIEKRKNNKVISEKYFSVLSLSLDISNANSSDLWRLSILGISNDDNKTNSDLEEETQQYFLETVQLNESGLHEVALPWIDDNSVLTSNRFLADRCLYKTNNKLIKTNKRIEYRDYFSF